jgi:hypothetical protein
MTCAIEDAGWEIRDCVMWVYGSGFPKSHDVSKAIDKAAGAEREVVGFNPRTGKQAGTYGAMTGNNAISISSTPLAQQWQGWGTALKPAVEYIVVAQKPLGLQGVCGTMALTIGEAICQLQSSANAAGLNSASSQNEFGVECGSALWNAAEKCNTPGGLCGLMGMSRSGMATPTSLSIALSWLDILGAVSTAASMFTTEMASSLTTDLRILNSLPSKIMAESIAQAATGQRGIGSSASLAESIFNVVEAKLASILTSSAPGFATSKGESQGLRPEWLPIIVARKPLVGTVAANVAEYGCGGMNVDGCRIGTNELTPRNNKIGQNGWKNSSGGYIEPSPLGRWPSNLIHDGSDEVTGLMGDAARFFYVAKASKADRDEGCEGLKAQNNMRVNAPRISEDAKHATRLGNHHPTVKPTDLMRYLCRLVTPPGGTVLDPFCGSGSTGKAATLEGFKFVGIEINPEYAEIAQCRIALEQHKMPLLSGAI